MRHTGGAQCEYERGLIHLQAFCWTRLQGPMKSRAIDMAKEHETLSQSSELPENRCRCR